MLGDKSQDQKRGLKALSLAWELGYLIILPLVIFALIGRILDNYFKTWPWFLLLGIVLAIISSSISLYFKINTLLKELSIKDQLMEKESDEKNKIEGNGKEDK